MFASSSYQPIIQLRQIIINQRLFIMNKSLSFKYMLFANCWGKFSAQYYRLNRVPNLYTKGWARETTSDDLFGYLFGDDFNTELAKALNVKIQEKPHDSI